MTVLGSLIIALTALAQSAGATVSSPESQSTSYHIGPLDTILITVVDEPELSRSVVLSLAAEWLR